jgi:multiple sugar transport system permease protein
MNFTKRQKWMAPCHLSDCCLSRCRNLPQLQAVFGTLFLLRFIWTFNKFDDVFLLTGGAANTKLITIEVYDQLFSSRNVGTSSAVAVLLALLLFVVVTIYFRWFMVEEY